MARPRPELHHPPLGPWQHTWRLLVCLVVSAAVWSTVAAGQWNDHRALWWTDVVVGLSSYVLVLGRRRWPLPVALVTQLLGVVSGIAAGPATLAAFSLATRLQLLPIVVVGAGGFLSATVFSATQPIAGAADSLWWIDAGLNLAVTVAIMAWGMYVGSRRQMVWTLRERAERAETEQALRTRQAQASERTRIAREMHDVLAHRISQISMHSGALTYRDDLDAAALRRGVGQIQQEANLALTDLRDVLGVLRDADGGLLDRPQPTYADVPSLLEEARAGGVRIDLTDRLDTGSVPEGTGRTLYRILQEGLTNVRRHAPGAPLRLRLDGSPDDGVTVRMSNPVGFGPSAASGTGLGLIGLAERAELRGGRLAHRRESGRFEVEAWLPWGP